jgi:hypothetical protein
MAKLLKDIVFPLQRTWNSATLLAYRTFQPDAALAAAM